VPSIVSNQAAETSLRRALEREGYTLNRLRNYGETGVDILATLGATKLYIEVIGHKSSPPARSKDFYEAFFRAISRTSEGAEHCVMALPNLAGRGLPSRAKHYGAAWRRLGEAFPELQIWLIDVENDTYEKSSWNRWLP
jgi:hypothetical protein